MPFECRDVSLLVETMVNKVNDMIVNAFNIIHSRHQRERRNFLLEGMVKTLKNTVKHCSWSSKLDNWMGYSPCKLYDKTGPNRAT